MKCNALDLNLFQFDHDLTFTVFFMNSDKTIYARYGVRNSMDADADVDVGGLRATMQSALGLHQTYPGNRESLRGKQPVKVAKSRPEGYEMLRKYKSELDYDGAVSKSCIHCHQIRDAQRLQLRTSGEKLPPKLMFPYPPIRSLGFELDPKTRATVVNSDAEKGSEDQRPQNGDEVVSVNGQTICSPADLSWILHNAKDGDALQFLVNRDGIETKISVPLKAGWRASTDISWRPTSWDVRRMATGGLSMRQLDQSKASKLGIELKKMALVVSHVGQYGAHARAKRAGFRKGDVIVKFDGRDDLLTESMVFEYAVQHKKPGDTVAIEFLRDGSKNRLDLRID